MRLKLPKWAKAFVFIAYFFAICLPLLGSFSTLYADNKAEAILAAQIKNHILRSLPPQSTAHKELSAIEPRFLIEVFRDRANVIFNLDDKAKALPYYEMLIRPDLEPNLTEKLIEGRNKELFLLKDAFSNDMYLAGTKLYSTSLSIDVFVRPFETELEALISKRLHETDAAPTYFRVAGLGADALEYEMMVKTLHRILKRLAPGKESEAVQKMDFRFVLYDRRNEILLSAAHAVKVLESRFVWLRGRTAVAYTDFIKPQLFVGWGSYNSAVVIARNSLRHDFRDKGRGFTEAMEQALLTGGVFVTDSLAAGALKYVTGLTSAGSFGLTVSEDDAFMLRKDYGPTQCTEALLRSLDEDPPNKK